MDTSIQLQRQSQGINALRFLLMVIVVFIHVLPDQIFPVQGAFLSDGAYSYTSELLSHVIGTAAVPTFFVISGYYALYSGKDYSRWATYWTEMRKKSLSLLLPYILWASLAVSIILCKQWLWSMMGLVNTDLLEITPPILRKLTSLLWTDVYAYQLWYLRDLLCMTLLLPLFCILSRRLPWLLGIFPLLYLSGMPIGVKGFSSVTLCFFSLGCLMGYYRVAVCAWAFKLRWLFTPLLILGLCLPFFNQSPAYHHAMRLFVFVLIGGFFLLTHYISQSGRLLSSLISLNRYTFFIYCSHTILIINFARGLALRLFSSLETLPAYFFVAILTIGACICLYHILRWLSPRLLALSLGDRL